MAQLDHDMMQPPCVEVEDKYWAQAHINWLIIDPYAWDSLAEHSPSEEEQDDLCEEFLGNREWDKEGEKYDPAKHNETLQQQGLNWKIRRAFIKVMTTKSAEMAAQANAEKKHSWLLTPAATIYGAWYVWIWQNPLPLFGELGDLCNAVIGNSMTTLWRC